ncbi:MAG: MgtC/SapB family protein [Rhizobiales bacterium]|nr:MgtC/SapB family protein [Hyphomicrobiales bacterium]
MNTLDFFLVRTAIPEWQIIGRLVIALLLGGAIGFDREVKNRPAGLRTHMLIALAAAIFSITTLEIVAGMEKTGHAADPIRAIEAVTAGVAFLAAGSIIQSRAQISGLTTGASMWLAGAIGVACGFGFFSIAVLATALALIVLVWLQSLSEKINPAVSPVGKNDVKP